MSSSPPLGSLLAAVHDADGIGDQQIAALARWTTLSETDFPRAPTNPAADCRVRIVTPAGELPFAEHVRLRGCHA